MFAPVSVLVCVSVCVCVSSACGARFLSRSDIPRRRFRSCDGDCFAGMRDKRVRPVREVFDVGGNTAFLSRCNLTSFNVRLSGIEMGIVFVVKKKKKENLGIDREAASSRRTLKGNSAFKAIRMLSTTTEPIFTDAPHEDVV